MAAVSPWAQLIDLTSGDVLASTTTIVKWSLQRDLDKPGPRSISVPAGDAGLGGFARVALSATGGSGISEQPIPILCEFSLDGGALIDARFLIEKTAPDAHTSGLLLTISGDDIGSLYNQIGPDRYSATDLTIGDVLGGAPGSLLPLSSRFYGVSADGRIPALQGILGPKPGAEPSADAPMWAPAAQNRAALTPVFGAACPPQTAVNIDAWEDTAGRLILSLLKTLSGQINDGNLIHVIYCDSDYNPVDNTPQALVLGNVGGQYTIMLDGDSTAAIPPEEEASRAALFPEETTIDPDLSTLYSEVRVVGGTSDAGLPPGAVLTALISLNNTPSTHPAVSWQDVLPIVAANVNDALGALYYDAGDYRLRLVPSWSSALPVYALAVDSDNGVIYAATSAGVYAHSTTDLALSTAPWAQVGGLAYKVTQLCGVGLGGGGFLLYALVADTSAEAVGVYQYNYAAPSAANNPGYAGWIRYLRNVPVVSVAVAQDGTSIFYLSKADQGKLFFHDTTSIVPTDRDKHWSLGADVTGVRVDTVNTAAGQQSVWVACNGGAQAAQYLLYDGVDWRPLALQPADADGSLSTAVATATGIGGQPPINRAVGLGYAVAGVTMCVVLCTSQGLYYMAGTIPASGGAGWSWKLNGPNGLAGYALTTMVAGQATELPHPNNPDGYITTNRLYAIAGGAYYASYSAGRYWRDITRYPVTLAPFFYSQAGGTGGIPDFDVQTVSGGPLPSGVTLRRRYNYCLEPYYSFINDAVAFPAQFDEPVQEVAVTPSVGIDAASAQLAAIGVVLLMQRSVRQTSVRAMASFTQATSGLRFLWPTAAVRVAQSGSIRQLSEDGMTVLDTPYIALGGGLYVLSITLQGDGPNYSAHLTLAPSLRGAPQTGDDLQIALVEQGRRTIKSLRNKR